MSMVYLFIPYPSHMVWSKNDLIHNARHLHPAAHAHMPITRWYYLDPRDEHHQVYPLAQLLLCTDLALIGPSSPAATSSRARLHNSPVCKIVILGSGIKTSLSTVRMCLSVSLIQDTEAFPRPSTSHSKKTVVPS